MVDENNKASSKKDPTLRKTWVTQLQIGGAVFLAGIVAAGLLIRAKKPPETKPPEVLGPLVSTIAAADGRVRMTVEAYGTVEPRVRVSVVPQVGGKVVAVHEALEAGGLIPAGEALVEIERADYELALQQAEAQRASAKASQEQAAAAIEQANTQLAIEKAEAAVAQSQWQATHPGQSPDPLVLRVPQIRQATAAVEAAKAQVASAVAATAQAEAAVAEAKLNLERTRVWLPYDVRVLSESVDVGQFVAPGQVIADVYGMEAVEITVMIDQRDLAWFDAPGSAAQVSAEFAGRQWTWAGAVDRLGGQVDVQSRLVPVVVRVAKPFEKTDGRPPLLPGTFARVEIQGRTVDDVVTIPRYAVHDGADVWVVREGVLRIVHPHIIRQTIDTAYISEGLAPGDRVITTLLDAITDGMKVRTAEEKVEARNSKLESDAPAEATPAEKAEGSSSHGS